VLSPSTRRTDLIEKREIYGAAGVGHLWFVDPIDRTLEVFALRDGDWVLATALRDDAEVTAPPFEAVGFPLLALWAGEAP
jgi:Uma2 family endonuclease